MFFYLSFLVQELLNILHILAFIAFEDACVWDSDLFVLWFVFVNLILCMAQWTGVHSQAYQVRISHPTSQSSPLPYPFFLKHTSLTRFILLEENFQSKMNNLLMGGFFFTNLWQSLVCGSWRVEELHLIELDRWDLLPWFLGCRQRYEELYDADQSFGNHFHGETSFEVGWELPLLFSRPRAR